jgi:hypothetical protein
MARGAPGEEVYTPQVQAEDLPRKVVPRMEPVPVGQAFEQAAAASNSKYQSDSATWAGDQITQARINAVQSLEQAKANAPTGDQTGFTQKYLSSFDKSNQDLADSAGGNPIARQMVTKGLTDLRQTLEQHSLGWEAQQNVAYRADSFQNNLKSQLPLIEAHPELAGQVGSTLMDQLNATGAEPAKRLGVAREMDSQISLAAANGLTRQDPRGALQALNNPDAAPPVFKPVLTGLTDAQREAVRAKANEHLGDAVYSRLDSQDIRGAQLALNKNEDLLDPKTAEQLQRTINAQVSGNLALQDKQQRDNSNALLKNAILMQKNGQLTPQWIEQHHNTWEPEAYEYAYKLLSGKESQTDPHVYAPLLTQALQGQDVSQKAQDALYAGQLTLPDYKAIADKSETPRKGYVARGADYISEALKPNPLVSDPAGQRSHANALDDWRQWTDEHPQATETEARKTYRDITDHYQVISSDKATVFMPVPLHLVGSRLQPDIIATAQATKKAHDSGEMSDDEYLRQSALVMQWQAALAKKTPPKAAP